MTNNHIEKKTIKILNNFSVLKAPIDVVSIANDLGVEIVYQDLDDDVSGFLVRKNNKNIIGLNQNQHEVRQRFTISHEIGHYILHSNQPLFIDYYKGSKLYRSNSKSKDYLIEKDANVFAASLLMPKKLILEELKGLLDNLNYDAKIEIMSAKFKVSKQAMDYRLKSLGQYDYGF